jgi:ankyrin repeat protein
MLTTAASPLPDRPSLDFLKDQAKRLLKKIRGGDAEAISLLHTHHPAFKGGRPEHRPPLSSQLSLASKAPALHDAQLVLARIHGFASWNRLKDEIESRQRGLLSRAERMIRAVWTGRLEDLRTELSSELSFDTDISRLLRDALAGVADRSVWHRPHYRDIARHLIGAGVECSGWTAARLGLLDHVKICLDADPALLHARDPQGRTILQRAALIYGSDPECEATAAWLIRERGAPIDIFTAAAYSMSDVVRAELRRDSTLVRQKCQGSTPLNWAVRPRRCTALIGWQATSHSAESEAKVIGDLSLPGTSESLSPDATICEMLLDFGADIESQDDQENGMHPLHHVGEWCGSEEAAALLIRRGADLHAVDNIGWTPLDYAINRNRAEMIACLKSHGARQTLVDWPNTWGERRDLLFSSVKRGDIATVERLLTEAQAKKTEVTPTATTVTPANTLANARQDGGDTPLHWAAHDGHFEIAALLLRHGADPAAQETRYWGGTPLHWAAERQPVLVQLLLQHGADINSRNQRTGQTPLHYCARCDDVPEVAELLLFHGADPTLRDNRAYIPLDYAVKGNHPLVASVLRQNGNVNENANIEVNQ